MKHYGVNAPHVDRAMENAGIGVEMMLHPELPEEFFLNRPFYETLCGLKVKFEDIVDHGSDCVTCSRLLVNKLQLEPEEWTS